MFFLFFERKIHLIDHTCNGFFSSSYSLTKKKKTKKFYAQPGMKERMSVFFFRMQKVCKRIFRAQCFTSFDARQTISLSHKLNHMSNEIFTSFLGQKFWHRSSPHAYAASFFLTEFELSIQIEFYNMELNLQRFCEREREARIPQKREKHREEEIDERNKAKNRQNSRRQKEGNEKLKSI